MARLCKHGNELSRFTRGGTVYSFRSDGTLLHRILGHWKLIRRKCDYDYFRKLGAKLVDEGFTEKRGEFVGEGYAPSGGSDVIR